MVMRVTDNRAYNIVSDIKSEHLPEVPEVPCDRITTLGSARQSTKNNKDQHGSNNLQHHILGELQAHNFGQLNMNSEW